MTFRRRRKRKSTTLKKNDISKLIDVLARIARGVGKNNQQRNKLIKYR